MGPAFFVTGTDTDAGKTVSTALMALALQAAYWKPVQAGTSPQTDSMWVSHFTHHQVPVFPEQHILALPASPHIAAEREGLVLHPEKWTIPSTSQPLLVEGAGGLMVPLRMDFTYADWIQARKIPVILVIHTRLGCINHALLTLEVIKHRGITLAGIVFNDGGREESEAIIAQIANVPILGRIPRLQSLEVEYPKQLADNLFPDIKEKLGLTS